MKQVLSVSDIADYKYNVKFYKYNIEIVLTIHFGANKQLAYIKNLLIWVSYVDRSAKLLLENLSGAAKQIES